MATDPDSDFWVLGELADGFLLHRRLFSELFCKAVGFFDAAQYGSEKALLPPLGKYLFGEDFDLSSLQSTLLSGLSCKNTVVPVPHGCALLSSFSLGCVMFKKDPTTNEIVTGRFRFKHVRGGDDSEPNWDGDNLSC